MKIIINKLVGDLGEQWAIEYNVPSDVLKAGGAEGPTEAIKKAVAPILRVVDDRLLELNVRLLNHNRVAQTLTPEGLQAVRQCVEVMYGRRVAPEGPQNPQPSAQTIETEEKVAQAASALEKALEAGDAGA